MVNKLGKPAFKSLVPTLYVARRDVLDMIRVTAVQGVFRQLVDQNANGLRIKSETKPSSNLILFKNVRNQRRRIRSFRMYKERSYDFLYGSKPYILNAEELATLYHFPGTLVRSPVLVRGTKQGEPPAGLPMG